MSTTNKQIVSEGICDKIIYQNPENGYIIFKLKQKDDTQICSATALHIKEGQTLKVTGHIEESKYGLQLRCEEIITILPKDKKGIILYLSSGIIPGIGEGFAKKLVDFAGKDLFKILDKDPQKLYQIKGIGKKRIDSLIQHWTENQALHEIIMHLQKLGIGPKRAMKIYRTYHDSTLHILQTNPYQIYQDIDGFGFKLADNIALNMGIGPKEPIRLSAASQYLLEQAMQSGHCFLPKDNLMQSLEALLNLNIEDSIDNICAHSQFHLTDKHVYLQKIYKAEREIEKQLKHLSKAPSVWKCLPANYTNSIQKSNLSELQKQAIFDILQSKIGIITGGPGVGKTTLTLEIVKLAKLAKLSIALCAPTGRAAKKLSSSTNMEAKTIHRLLKMDPIEKRFLYNASNPIKADLIIIDEASMIDIFLANHLLQATDSLSNLILIGDIDQLPAVGPGAFLKDMMSIFPNHTAHLTEIFRQAKHSKIILNAHQVNKGKMLIPNNNDLSDFYMIPKIEPDQVVETIQTMISKRIPDRFSLNPVSDIQILCPMHKGSLGTQRLNQLLQSSLNPAQANKTRFKLNDKVIQLKNNYDKDVFNGDIGFIKSINDHEITIDFSDKFVNYQLTELDELELAYAISIHKSQGSEYPCVIIPLGMQHYTLLERNLLYTAITRGKQLVVLIGDPKAIAMAIRNQKSKKRYTNINITL